MDNEELTTGSEASAGLTSEPQAAETSSQEPSQSQSLEGSQVETSSTYASSASTPKRSNNNWAQTRIIQKAVRDELSKELSSQLGPLLEEIRGKAQQPSATSSQPQEQPDYENLPGWLNKKVETLLQQKLEQDLPKNLNQFKSKLEGDFKRTTAMQEARNYLISQQDIGRDRGKLDEIEQIMSENLLDLALEQEPLKAIQLAVNLWRKQKQNPNAPSKAQLSTVSGGAPAPAKKELGIKELMDLQKKLAGPLTIDEREKLNSQVDSLR